MGSKGNNRHIKRLAAPTYLHVERKVNAYVLKPNAGRHTAHSTMALSTIIKEKLNFAQNANEVKRILKAGSVEVNGKIIKDPRYPIGYGDHMHFKPSGEKYTVTVAGKGVIKVAKTEHEHSKAEHAQKVIGKYIAPGNKEMIRLLSGIILPSAKGVHVNDSVIVKDGKIGSVLKLEKGAKCLVVNGVHASEEGTIAEIKKGSALRDATVEIHSGKKGNIETLIDNIVVTGAK